jgi:hypothetical protein
MKSIQLDVRPALDSFEALHDRLIRMPTAIAAGKSTFTALPFFASSVARSADEKQAELLDMQVHSHSSHTLLIL